MKKLSIVLIIGGMLAMGLYLGFNVLTGWTLMVPGAGAFFAGVILQAWIFSRGGYTVYSTEVSTGSKEGVVTGSTSSPRMNLDLYGKDEDCGYC